ncbi:hypothetical protein [Herbaspirillum robiniae]|uniref:hypothetical protein n=1 Tax=Herbaspirillum robiniae TaxID=2014887 RepID=UPI003D781A94
MKRLLLSFVALAAIVKGGFFFVSQMHSQVLWLTCIVSWVFWVINAVFEDRDLPAPFAYDSGENQIGRIAYGAVVLIVFFFYVFFG